MPPINFALHPQIGLICFSFSGVVRLIYARAHRPYESRLKVVKPRLIAFNEVESIKLNSIISVLCDPGVYIYRLSDINNIITGNQEINTDKRIKRFCYTDNFMRMNWPFIISSPAHSIHLVKNIVSSHLKTPPAVTARSPARRSRSSSSLSAPSAGCRAVLPCGGRQLSAFRSRTASASSPIDSAIITSPDVIPIKASVSDATYVPEASFPGAPTKGVIASAIAFNPELVRSINCSWCSFIVFPS